MTAEEELLSTIGMAIYAANVMGQRPGKITREQCETALGILSMQGYEVGPTRTPQAAGSPNPGMETKQ